MPASRFILILFLFIVNFSFSKEDKLKEFNGFFNFSYDESKDKIFLKVDNLEYEFLYVGFLASGVG